jgi:hypothetical protein
VITFIIITPDAYSHIQEIQGSIPDQNTDHPESFNVCPLHLQENSELGP